MTARKRWRLVYPGAPVDRIYTFSLTAYDVVDELRREWAAGGPISTLTVQVDEGSGWQPYDHIDFALEAS